MSTSDAMRRAVAALGRADAATEGPWDRHDFGHAGEQEPSSIVVHTGRFDWTDLNDPEGTSAVAWMGAWDSQEDANAEFIAAARDDVPRFASFALAVLAMCEDYDEWQMLLTDPTEPALSVSKIKAAAQRFIEEGEPAP